MLLHRRVLLYAAPGVPRRPRVQEAAQVYQEELRLHLWWVFPLPPPPLKEVVVQPRFIQYGHLVFSISLTLLDY